MKSHSAWFPATPYVRQNHNLHGYGSDYVSISMINPRLGSGLLSLFLIKESGAGEEPLKVIVLLGGEEVNEFNGR